MRLGAHAAAPRLAARRGRLAAFVRSTVPPLLVALELAIVLTDCATALAYLRIELVVRERLDPSAIVAVPAERLRRAQGIRALAHLVRWCSAASRRTPLVPFEMLGNRCCVVADRAMPGAASSEVLAWASVRIDDHRIVVLTGCSHGICSLLAGRERVWRAAQTARHLQTSGGAERARLPGVGDRRCSGRRLARRVQASAATRMTRDAC